jgi:hypothetical protein
MRLFTKTAVCAALIVAAGLLGGERAKADTLLFTPDGIGGTSLNTTTPIVIPGDPAGGTLSLNLTIGADYSSPANLFPGANGSFSAEVDTLSTPFWSYELLSAAPSTSGTTNYGDQTGIFSQGPPLTDISLWTVNILANDSPITLTLSGLFTGYCPPAGACFTPNSTFSYDFTPNVATTPLPAALPLFASGLGAMGLLGWRRRRKVQATA